MDDLWQYAVPLLTAIAGYFARSVVDSGNRAVQAVWNEYKTRRRHREHLEKAREQNKHTFGMRELDLEHEIVKRGTSRGGYESGVRNPRRR